MGTNTEEHLIKFEVNKSTWYIKICGIISAIEPQKSDLKFTSESCFIRPPDQTIFTHGQFDKLTREIGINYRSMWFIQ